jgi:uncharacterized damage-inducible protein DinB
MSIAESLLPEFDHEMDNTRRTLERVPEARFQWKPHPRSGTLGWLATHLAELPAWAINTIGEDSLDISPDGQPPKLVQSAATLGKVLETFDTNRARARAAIPGASDAVLFQPWTLLSNGRIVFAMPRVAVLRGQIFNHLVHHRGQLTVYLRLNDVPVPDLYGPSADEGSL